MRASAVLMTVVLAAAGSGCGGAAAEPSSAEAADPSAVDAADDGAAETATSDPSEPTASPPSGGAASPAPSGGSREPVLARDSYPPGAEPLGQAEQQEVKAKCEPVVRHVKRLATKDRGRKQAAEYVEQLAANPPTLAGVDVPRCTELLVRDTRAYVAKSVESQATINLKRIMVGLADAMARDGRLCPSAPAVPRSVSAVANGPYQAKPAEWQVAGWRCVNFDLHRAPQHYQYEVKTNAKAQSFEIIARGYPVAGQPVVELFLPGKVEAGTVELHSNVYRR